MANRTFSFRLPDELIDALEEQARISGKTKTDLVIEALTQVYGLTPPPSSTVTIEAIQKQIDGLKQQLAVLQDHEAEAQAEIQDNTLSLITALREALQPLQRLSLPAAAETETAIAPTPSTPDVRITPVSVEQVTLLEASSAYDPEGLATQVQYQMQVFDQIFSAIPELVFICDRTGHFTYVSPVGARVWGIERAELLGRLYYDVSLPPEFLEFHLAQFETALTFGKLSSAELSVLSSQTCRYYEYTLSPIQDDSGVVIGAVGIAIDITQRKQAELALFESLERYRNLFELANDMIFIVDVESHQIIDANLKAARRLRYTRKELCQLHIDDLEPPEAATYFRSVIIPQLEKTGSAIFIHSLRRKNGDILPVEISMRLIEYGDRLVYQSFARDVSERRHPQLDAAPDIPPE